MGKNFLKICLFLLAKVHRDRNAQTLPVGTGTGTTLLQGNMAEHVYQSLKTHTPSGPVLPLSVILPKLIIRNVDKEMIICTIAFSGKKYKIITPTREPVKWLSNNDFIGSYT